VSRIQIIGAPFSSYVWVVRMACEEKGVAYDLVPARMHSPEVSAVHPFGKIPIMRHGDIALCESKAIATYIDRAFPGPRLIPDDACGAAEVEQWVSLVNTTIDPCLIRTYVLSYLNPKGAGGSPDRAAIDAVLPTMQKQIDVLDKAVARTGYLVGEDFTLADIYVMPMLTVVQRPPEGAELVQAASNLFAYFTRHAERKSYQESLPALPTGPSTS
jgi:glutathione S-transferase